MTVPFMENDVPKSKTTIKGVIGAYKGVKRPHLGVNWGKSVNALEMEFNGHVIYLIGVFRPC